MHIPNISQRGFASIALAALTLAACSTHELPLCGDDEVLGLVREIVDDAGAATLHDMVRIHPDEPAFEIRLESARMSGYDRSLPVHHCQVELVTELLGKAAQMAQQYMQPSSDHITLDYDIQWTDDNQLWVQVHDWP